MMYRFGHEARQVQVRSRRRRAVRRAVRRTVLSLPLARGARRVPAKPRRPDLAAAERNAHDVTDRRSKVAGVVGQRQIETRRANRRQRVNGARYRRTAVRGAAQPRQHAAHRALGHSTPYSTSPIARGSTKRICPFRLLLIAAHRGEDRSGDGARAQRHAEQRQQRQHAQMFVFAESPGAQTPATPPRAGRALRAAPWRRSDTRTRVSIACAKVCPRFSSSRIPTSCRSSATIIGLDFDRRRNQRVHGQCQNGAARVLRARRTSSCPSMIPALTTSARPSRSEAKRKRLQRRDVGRTRRPDR